MYPASCLGDHQRSVTDRPIYEVGRDGNDPQDVVKRIEEAIHERTSIAFDPHRLFGDPTAAISVFALMGFFVSAIFGKVAEDVYTVLKDKIRSAPRATRIQGRETSEWVVLHDVEHNCALESPALIPLEAAVQLANLARQDLERAHLRWNSQTNVWDLVGRNPVEQTVTPPSGTALPDPRLASPPANPDDRSGG